MEDLKQQADKLYRERNEQEPIPTSDSLSMKKLIYIAIGLAAVVLLTIQFFGGFKKGPDPVIAAATPPPLIKEEPPPDVLNPEAVEPPEAKEATKPQPKTPAALSQPEPKAPAPKSVKPAREERAARNVTAEAAPKTPAKRKNPATKKEKTVTAEAAPPEPVETKPAISPEELARRELAHDMVVQRSPALAKMLGTSSDKGWNAEPVGEDAYLVTFQMAENADATPDQYVWRVDLSRKSVTPLSYYARKLS